ncbi:MAG TPA: hypothetical protein VFD60_10720 [Nitrososphaeraceae archaeon]|nr:hypothetical protein [Nitrososphaeraceae archaeon]
MEIVEINIEELLDYIEAAVEGDEKMLDYYDYSQHLNDISEVAENILNKLLLQYDEAMIYGVESEGEKIGYFVGTEDLLVSFGMNINYRNKEYLTDFWAAIKEKIGDRFNCVLYAHNKRGISFLEKGGMRILFENVTILTNN